MGLDRVKRSLLLVAAAFVLAGGAMSADAATPSVIVFSADRAPFLSGEIYRADSGGRVVDLSNDTAAQDTNPVVSPDGKRVAFLSNRSGQEGVYAVGIDGTGLTQVARSLPVGGDGTELAWQPRGGRLAVAGGGGVWVVRPGHAAVRVTSATALDGWTNVGSVDEVLGWSPDGRMLAVTAPIRHGSSSSHELVVSPRGRTLWKVPAAVGPWGSTWSRQGLLAVTTGGNTVGAQQALAVYGRTGRLRFKVRFGRLHPPGNTGPWSTWSPDGTRVALVSGRAFQVRTTTGRLVLREKLPALRTGIGFGSLAWVGNDRIVVAGTGPCGCHATGVDVRTGTASPASSRFTLPTSADQKLAILRAVASGGGFEIRVAPTAGGPPRSYGHVPGCDDIGGGWFADFGSPQFVPGRESLVYASDCTSPAPGLYSVAPGGGPIRQITTSRSAYWTPALSPDGTKVAYAGNACAGLGCSDPTSSIGVVNADGSGERTLTNPPACEPSCCGDYDEYPSWSPDGTTILFGRDDCNSGTATPELYTVPASGGAVHDLGFRGYAATWGPSKIAYEAPGPSGDAYVWTANPDGTDQVPVGSGDSPAWSPTGQLAYLKNDGDVVVGSTRMRFPFASIVDLAWSPDGTRLVVTARKTSASPTDVYSIDPNGTDPVPLTQNYDAGGVSGR